MPLDLLPAKSFKDLIVWQKAMNSCWKSTKQPRLFPDTKPTGCRARCEGLRYLLLQILRKDFENAERRTKRDF